MGGKRHPPVEKKCLYCGDLFIILWCMKHQKFCCKECADKSQRKPQVMITCLQCGKIFSVDQSRKDEAKYCSVECYNESLPGKIWKVCPVCNKEFWVFKSGEDRVCCSHSCDWSGKRNPRYNPDLGGITICDYCGKEFPTLRSKSQISRFCSRQCNGKYFSGPNSFLWRGGTSTEDELLRNSAKNINWRKSVFERDDYTCQFCGEYEVELHGHHLKPWVDHPEDRFIVENGITLCKKCHVKLHSHIWEIEKEILAVCSYS